MLLQYEGDMPNQSDPSNPPPDIKVAQDLSQLAQQAASLAFQIGEISGITQFLTARIQAMAQDQAALVAKITELGADVTSYEAREQATIDALNQTILDLQNSGDQTAAITQLQAIIDAIPSQVPPIMGDASKK